MNETDTLFILLGIAIFLISWQGYGMWKLFQIKKLEAVRCADDIKKKNMKLNLTKASQQFFGVGILIAPAARIAGIYLKRNTTFFLHYFIVIAVIVIIWEFAVYISTKTLKKIFD